MRTARSPKFALVGSPEGQPRWQALARVSARGGRAPWDCGRDEEKGRGPSAAAPRCGGAGSRRAGGGTFLAASSRSKDGLMGALAGECRRSFKEKVSQFPSRKE